jgi:transposase
MPLPPELPITEDDWNLTPAAVQAVVIALWQQVQALQAQVAALQAEVALLREQMGRNSQNSSKPPLSDAPSAPPRPKRAPSGRKPGGQAGHPGHGRKLVSVEQVQRVIDLKPTGCDQCGALLMGKDAHPVRRQVTELPRVEPEVTEYRQHTLTCLACGAQTQAEFPAEVPAGCFGPRVQATVGYLTGRIGVSQRDVEEVMQTVFHTDISLGSIPAQEDQVSAALAEPVQAVQTYVQQQPVQNVDETSWREKTERAWLWINTTPLVTLFLVLATRGGEGRTAHPGQRGQEHHRFGSLVGLQLA